MHEEVLSEDQHKLLPLLKSFRDDFGLIRGTAMALEIGHRRSIDFDLATFSEFNARQIRDRIGNTIKIDAVLVDETYEYTLVVNEVKLTFLHYPFNFEFGENYNDIINLPDEITLSALKAYALGRRAKWKDYVDLYFVISRNSFKDVVQRAKFIFKEEFNEKLFREQLAYFEDIDYSEKIDYLQGFSTSEDVIKSKLTQYSLEKP